VESLYTCLVCEDSPSEPYVQPYWAYGSHLGEALARVQARALSNGFRRPTLKEADPFDPGDLQDDIIWAPDRLTGWAPTQYFFPPGPGFTLPWGVIASCEEGEFDVDDIAPGYRASVEDGLHTIELNTSEDRLVSDYALLLNTSGPFKVFWVVIHGHWTDDAGDLFLVNESLTSADVIERFLRADLANTVRNGYLTFTAYSDEGATNINISDHKKVVAFTRSASMASRLTGALKSVGYTTPEPFNTVDHRFHHWHYRDPRGLGREALIEALLVRGFAHWDPDSKSAG
jgi:hypothetical protein